MLILHRMVRVKRHHPYSGHEELQKLRKTSARFEEQIYNAATNRVCLIFFSGPLLFAYHFNNIMLEIMT